MASTLIAIVVHLAPVLDRATLLLVFCFWPPPPTRWPMPSRWRPGSDATIAMRLGWAVGMGALTALLLVAGDGSINTSQFIVITAVPVTFILLPTAVTAPMALKALSEKASTKRSRDLKLRPSDTTLSLREVASCLFIASKHRHSACHRNRLFGCQSASQTTEAAQCTTTARERRRCAHKRRRDKTRRGCCARR